MEDQRPTTFNVPAGHPLAGVPVPKYWAEWSPFKTCHWVQEQGHAGNILEAVEVLKSAGQWPTEEEIAAQTKTDQEAARRRQEARKTAAASRADKKRQKARRRRVDRGKRKETPPAAAPEHVPAGPDYEPEKYWWNRD